MVSPKPAVVVLDDDLDALQSLQAVLSAAGFEVATFTDADSCIQWIGTHKVDCLLVDLRLSGQSALDVLNMVRDAGCAAPFIVITGAGDVRSAVRAMQQGVTDFFTKPLDQRKLVARIREAVEQAHADRDVQSELQDIAERLKSLTLRERQVLERVVEGKVTKEIAAELGISSKTVEVHRSHVTRKMHVRSVAELVRIVTLYEISQQPDSDEG